MNIPQDQRVISDEGKLENIDKWYQTFHEKDDFVVNADIGYKLSLLLKYRRIDEVWYYYRNKYVQEYLDNKDSYENRQKLSPDLVGGRNLILQ